MSKERLEEVVKNVVFNECGITGAPMSVELPEDDYWYLKEQAKRVQNLEERLKRQIERNWDKERLSELLPDTIYYIDKLKEEIKNLERRLEEQIESNRMYMWKNKRYREALKFYADERNYEDIGIPTGNNPPALPILEDRGQVARKELDGEE